MSDGAKLVCFYVLTTPLGNGLGCFKAGMGAMVEDSRINPKSFRESFGECISKGWFEYDEHNRVLMIPKYFERNPPINPNGITAVGKYFASIPASDLKTKCYQVVEKWAATKMESFMESFHKSFGVSLPEPPGKVSPSPSPSYSGSPPSSSSEAVKKEKIYKKEKSHKPDIISPDFMDFWASWPSSKIGRAAAWKRWEILRKSGFLPPVDKLKQALIQQDLARGASKATGGFVPPWPHPGTWLNEERWNDEIKVETTATTKGPMTQQEKNIAILKAGREKRAREREQPPVQAGKCEVIR